MARRRGGRSRKRSSRHPRYLGGRDAISFTGRSMIIAKYAPPKADRVVEKVNEVAKLYAQGRITKKQYLSRVKAILRKAGLSEKEWKMIYEKIKRKGQV